MSFMVLGWTAPNGIAMCQIELSKPQARGTVPGEDYVKAVRLDIVN